LLTDPALIAKVEAEVPTGQNLTYRLHPPMLRAMGMTKKIGLGPSTHGLLRTMARAKRLRGTPLDPFGYAHVRRVERELRDHYMAMIEALARDLDDGSYETATAAAAAADLVRGYEHVKLGNVRRYQEALAALDLPPSVPPFPVVAGAPPEARPHVTLAAVPTEGLGVHSRSQPDADQVEMTPDEPLHG
jgi:indolepyruvate ferredoxin oxidoreductase